MAKIIKLDGEKILIGLDDGNIKEVRAIDVNFAPAVGDEVEVYESESATVVTKKESKKESNNQGGININVSNNQTTSQAPYQYVASGSVVNKVVYCILAFFLGGIGAHKFYAGKVGSGLMYLLFFWTAIPAFIAFIEFIVALCKKADANGNILV